ncbi:MAG TPA: ATP-binding protein [Usitatibacter sp.]|nr:ATP-binding protein [Usitatibacter sp.]
MKIRSHLLVMVVGALLPLLVFSTALTAYSWWQERTALEFRQLERVRAITIALDTELQASIRVLNALGLAASIDPANLAAAAATLQSVAVTQPLWATLALGDPLWREPVAVNGKGTTSPPAIAEETRRKVVEERVPAISALVKTDAGLRTQVAAPVMRDGRVIAVLLAEVDPRSWLGFVGQYPVATGATMTLLDQHGRVIARSLNNDRWAGGMPSDDVLRNVRERAEGAFRSSGLEGQQFYSAHSRSARSGWTVVTGLPAEAVEISLRDSSWWLLGTSLITILGAVLLALMLGHRIERPIALLGESARALERGEDLPLPEDGEIDEVREVGHAFHSAATRLGERERALNAALAGEREARQEAEQANAAKDEYLAMLGHELRNPLNAITSATAILNNVDPRAERADRAREIIGRQIRHLRELVDDLLDVARVTRGMISLERRPLDIGRVVCRTVMAMSGSGRLGQHQVDTDCGVAFASADETRIEQIATNLIDNAAKYTHEGGRIRVSTRTEGEFAVIRVEDNGMGISPELLPRVFDLFTQGERTLDRSQGGLGLGLALVRRLVEMHGGTVSAVSKGPGKGSCFTVRIPLVEAPPEAQPPSQEPADGKPLRILVVEDNPDGRETLAMMLGMRGHEVHQADTGPKGVESAVHLHPDVAIVDIGLPGYDGYEVARRVRAQPAARDIRLVALTGYGQEEDRKNALAAGFDWFMVKPADLEALNRILAEVSDG